MRQVLPPHSFCERTLSNFQLKVEPDQGRWSRAATISSHEFSSYQSVSDGRSGRVSRDMCQFAQGFLTHTAPAEESARYLITQLLLLERVDSLQYSLFLSYSLFHLHGASHQSQYTTEIMSNEGTKKSYQPECSS